MKMEGSTGVVRAYVDGVEIDKIPALKEVCALDDWMDGLLKWASTSRPELKMDAIFVGESTNLMLAEIWIGGAPPLRAIELGGIIKHFSKEPSGP